MATKIPCTVIVVEQPDEIEVDAAGKPVEAAEPTYARAPQASGVQSTAGRPPATQRTAR